MGSIPGWGTKIPHATGCGPPSTRIPRLCTKQAQIKTMQFLSTFISFTFLIVLTLGLHWACLVAQLVKNLPVMQETPVRFLGREDPLEKG